MTADVCLILEGTYPYVRGGVSNWTHEMIQRQSHLKFHVLSILPRDERPEQKYVFPENVIGHTVVHLQRLEPGKKIQKARLEELLTRIRLPLARITTGESHLDDFRTLLSQLGEDHIRKGAQALLNSMESWEMLTSMYEEHFNESSMLDYFWSWRAIIGGLYSLLQAELPEAKTYHALSTGYAGMMLARAAVETNKPTVLTEHGIYTNERRVEIALADWLTETAPKSLTIDRTRMSLRDFWMTTFTNYSRIAYEAADHIITLYEGNQIAQKEDGADKAKMRVIPNGVDLERFGKLARKPKERPTIATIGRVVPIKDIKAYLRAVSLLRAKVPDVRALIVGPTDEDTDYVRECQEAVEYLGLHENVTFTGQVLVEDYLPEVDVTVFTSLSEAQPLVLLEAAAAGIPSAATDVGACRELIMGKPGEKPEFHPGGVVVPVSNPRAMADALAKLLADKDYWKKCSEGARGRVETFYDKNDLMNAYRELYDGLIENGKGDDGRDWIRTAAAN